MAVPVSGDLAAFYAARLDEDEWIAQGAARTDDGYNGSWLPVYFGSGGFDARVDDHIARHDPARVLREVAAGRKLLADYELAEAKQPHDDAEYAHGYADGIADGLLQAVKHRVSAYGDHPDYRAEWKP